MITIYCQPREHLTGPERAMVRAMRDLPGVLVVNALVTTGKRTRELDGVWIHPRGLVALEAKGSALRGTVTPHANSAWTIGRATADFASGPNPTLQARLAAQVLKGSLGRGAKHWVTPVLVVAGDVELAATRVADVHAVATSGLQALLLEQSRTGDVITHADASSILRALDLDGADAPEASELTAEGFPDAAPQPAPAGAPSRTGGKERRRARRLAELEAQARQTWHRSHVRRIVASALAAAVLVGVMPRLPWYCTVVGVSTGIGAGLYQLWVRRNRSGPRHHGPNAMALWLLSLLPVAGIGATLSWMAALPVLETMQWPFVLTLAILLACAMACGVLTGRSAYVHPPELVLERFDEDGRGTGAFTLAGVRRDQWPAGDWRPVSDSPSS